jgi:hypothetical protein
VLLDLDAVCSTRGGPGRLATPIDGSRCARMIRAGVASAGCDPTRRRRASFCGKISARALFGRAGAMHVVVMAGAYHGHTTAVIELSPYKFDGPGGQGKPPHIHVMPCPDPYRGLHLDGRAAARAAIADAEAAGGRVCAFFSESILSCGGQVGGGRSACSGALRVGGEWSAGDTLGERCRWCAATQRVKSHAPFHHQCCFAVAFPEQCLEDTRVNPGLAPAFVPAAESSTKS